MKSNYKGIFWILFFGLIISNSISAQKKYQKGYIITNGGDTIYGNLRYREEIKNFYSCIFIKEGEKNKVKYYPNDIKGYRFIDGNYYISKELKINNKPRKFFVEYLVNGIVDLYYRRSQSLGDEFYIDNGVTGLINLSIDEQEIILSGNEKMRIGVSSKTFLFRKKTYIGNIKAIMKDCPEIMPEIDNISLAKNDLMNITKKYHDYVCNDFECITYYKQPKENNISYNFVFFSDIQNFVVNDNSYFRDLRPMSSYYDSKGIGFTITLQPFYKTRRHSFDLGISLQSSNYYNYYSGKSNNYEFFFNSSIVEPSISYVNKDIVGFCKLFWGVGLSNFIYLDKETKMIYYTPSYFDSYTERSFSINNDDFLPNNVYSFNLFTGIEFNIKNKIRPFIQIDIKLLKDYQIRETIFQLDNIIRFKTGISF